ncbi:hypothetical protein Nepgr_020973 [Nepenthes gracilis]|uniref:Uncharacterized protein n=1 Tax=Nepenthes gracilis TaxID=150966 RepID=A0AAD3SXZ6_NEPGR|nr:hypothetical protein Nepgr_020973 [Nepenthes gracilis]
MGIGTTTSSETSGQPYEVAMIGVKLMTFACYTNCYSSTKDGLGVWTTTKTLRARAQAANSLDALSLIPSLLESSSPLFGKRLVRRGR